MAFNENVGLGGNALLRPSSSKQIQGTNYVPTNDFQDQFLPEVDGAEVERFGPRTMTAILEKFSGTKSFASSEIKWTEQNRLHTLYNNVTHSGNAFTVRTQDGGTTDTTAINHNLRIGQTVFVQDSATAPTTDKGVITAITATGFTALSYETAAWDNITTSADGSVADGVLTLMVYGSDFGKGTFGMSGSLEADPEIYTVKPIIFKDHYKINGSDTAQIGWIEGITEAGTTGYLWYLKSKSEQMLRWTDYLEMGLIEGVPAVASSGAIGHVSRLDSTVADNGFRSADVVGGKGVTGLFYQIEQRGHEFDAFFAGGVGALLPATIDTYEKDVENIILALEEQAAISTYTWWVNRKVSLNIDKWLATKNGGVTQINAGHANGADVPADALGKGTVYPGGPSKMQDFGFMGFQWGGYHFAKTDWRYLNDPTLRGAIGDVTGLMLPAGTTTVYDMNLGKNATNPFVYIAYRANEIDNRMNKEWITGSIGAYTDDEDALKCHFLSERALIVQAANNMVVLK